MFRVSRSSSEPGVPAAGAFRRVVVTLAVFLGALIVGEFWREVSVKVLWLDELYTHYQVHGKTAGAFFDSLRSGANLMPPGYFLGVWGLGAVGGWEWLTPTVLRLPSALALVLAVPVLALALRRVAVWPVAALAVAGGLLFDRMFWAQVAEARPYALGILLAALLAEAVVNGAGGDERGGGRWRWAGLAAVNFLLPATHYFLGLYSALALLAVVVGDVCARRMRVRVWLAFAAGWALFLGLCGPILWDQLANVGAGTGWIAPSSRSDLWRYLVAAAPGAWVPLAAVVGVVLIRRSAMRREMGVAGPGGAGTGEGVGSVREDVRGKRSAGDRDARRMAAVLALAWAGFPVAVLAVSVVTDRGLYVDRYFAPSVVGVVLGVALVGEILWGRFLTVAGMRTSGEKRIQAGAGFCVVVGVAVMTAGFFLWAGPGWRPGRERLAEEIHARAQLKVTADEHAYFHGLYYARAGERYALICESDEARRRWARFSGDVRTISEAELAEVDEFVWLSPTTKKPEGAFPGWAAEHGYTWEIHEAPATSGAVSTGWRTYYVFKRGTAMAGRRLEGAASSAPLSRD